MLSGLEVGSILSVSMQEHVLKLYLQQFVQDSLISFQLTAMGTLRPKVRLKILLDKILKEHQSNFLVLYDSKYGFTESIEKSVVSATDKWNRGPQAPSFQCPAWLHRHFQQLMEFEDVLNPHHMEWVQRVVYKCQEFELFLKGKDLWGHIDGTDVEKPSTFDKSQDVGFSPSWVVLDARIMSWLLGSVEPHIVTHLRPHHSAQSMWAYLKKVYHQDNDARRFQLEHAIAMFQHGSLSIQDYYSAFLTLWHEYADLVTADVPIAALSTIQTIHATTRRDQFLMKLRPEYESVRSSLLNRSPVPSLDICFGELLREEQRLSTQAILEQSHGSSGTATVAYVAQGRGPPMHSKNLQCFCCKEYGHIAATCPKKFCSYCKKKGHIIKEYRIRPQNRQAQAFQTSVIVPPIATSATHDSPSTACSVPAPPAPDYCTPEMVQQMLISALSAIGFQGNNSTKLWYVDSGASNHMTNNPTALCHDQVTGKPIAKGPKVGRLFPLFLPVPDFSPLSSIKSFACNNVSDLSMVWHRRLGHPNTQILSHVLNSDLPGNKDRYSLSLECDSCKLGKSKTLPFPLHASRASHCFDLIHSDVWGPSPISSYEKFKYYVTFIDDHTRFTWVYFLRSKSEVFRTFTEFLAYVDNQFSTSIKTLRTDSGGEYLSTEFQAFLASKEALKFATHLINRLPSQVLHMESSYFRLFAKEPSYDHLRIFGCECYFFENQHFFPVSSSTVSSSSTVVLPSFEQQFLDLHPVSSRLQPGIVYTRRSRPQSLSVAHLISDPTTLQMQSVAAPSVHRSSRVSVPPNRYGFPSSSSGNSISALTAALSKFDIPTCYSHAAKHDFKVRSDGSLDRYKARLVALGNNQEYGVNYEETFAPVAKMTIVRTILALAASSDWPLHQMDVKNAFLHGDLKECIYMKPPPGLFPSPTSHSKYDTSLFLRKSDMGIVVLLVYVDDIVITGSDSALLGQLKTHLSESFHMKDLGSLTYFLGLEVHHSPSGISLNQHKYASDLVATAGLQGATSVDTPMQLNVKLRKEEGDLLADPSLYRKLVGSLVYLTINRLDISFAVQQVSQFLQTPRHLHLAAVRRIICYVQGTSTRGLFFPAGNSTRLAAYSDADWAGCADTCRSITGWCVFLGDALISWKNFSETDPTPLHADNTSAIQITANPIYHERTKHIEVDCHSIREAFEARVITLPHISTDLQIADIFTKALPRHRHCLLMIVCWYAIQFSSLRRTATAPSHFLAMISVIHQKLSTLGVSNFSNLSKHHFLLFFVSGMNGVKSISLMGVSSPLIGETTNFVESLSAIEGADSAGSRETSRLERTVGICSAHGLRVSLILPTP
ncbi:Retrovirus-related Pol polyprotein from transposon RE1 [Vitis vinifera]|uniref:Retrovirus-related Pol polyprotein from transposon RE1 n=1 Tax=Vitis vinifera TaxID=29760 RepID=A0A438FXV3_VITVI|nr:Retrovirus-related Pol polyprotein from transposon RE1 [Vitis vinifera]